jgi:DnaJ-domain-containing protein 1
MASRRLHGEVLVDDFLVPSAVVGDALRRQLSIRLAILDRLPDARIAFRVVVRPPRGALVGRSASPSGATWDAPLGPQDFLRGRRRARERTGAAPTPSRGGATPWEVLGLPSGAAIDEVKRAYRRLARSVHPDLHPHAGDAERHVLVTRFMALTDAYRALIDAA